MNAARAAAVTLIAFAGVATPATSAHADDQLVCGLLTPCGGETGDETTDDPPAPIDDKADIVLDVDLELDLVAPVDVELFPSSGTSLTVDSDVDHAALQLAAADHTLDLDLDLDLDVDVALDSDTSIGHDGIVVAGDGTAIAAVTVTTWRKVVGVDAANQLCGVQLVVGRSSSATCEPASAGAGSSNDGLVAVAESVDVCGAHVVVAGSATANCGDAAATRSPAAGSSWTLADAGAAGTACGLSVTWAGDSGTTCAGAGREAPGGRSGPDGSGTAAPATGATGAVAGGASSPARGAQPAAAPNDDGSGTTAGDSGGSLPLTGASVLLLLMIAAAVVATGLVAVRSSRVRVGHQS
jgi:hypothetical protein